MTEPKYPIRLTSHLEREYGKWLRDVSYKGKVSTEQVKNALVYFSKCIGFPKSYDAAQLEDAAKKMAAAICADPNHPLREKVSFLAYKLPSYKLF